MLLAIDIGNTNIVVGAYVEEPAGAAGAESGQADDDAPLTSWRLGTKQDWGQEDFRRTFDEFWEQSRFSPQDFGDAVLCSVVPALTELWRSLLSEMLAREPVVLHQGMKLGMALDVKRPENVGMDRLADAVAVRRRTKGAAVAVDFGTATTFNVVDAGGRFRGGAIAPGLHSGAVLMLKEAPALPAVELTAPDSAIGRDTDEALQSGIVLGYTGLVEGLLARISHELATPVTVIATGGLGHIITPLTSSIDLYDPWLTLDGIRTLYRLNAKRE